MVSVLTFWAGFNPISMAAHSMSAAVHLFPRHLSFVWSSTGIGPWTHPVRAVHGALAAVGRQTSALPTSVR